MAFEIEYTGGVAKPTYHSQVKFLLFVVVGGYEQSFYRMLQDGLAQKPEAGKDRYLMSHNIVKIFTQQQGFATPHRFHSFYFIVQEKAAPLVTVTPFPGAAQACPFYFKARGRFLSKAQALELLSEDQTSRAFLQKQVMLPLDTLRQMVTIDRSVMREGVRHVRIGRVK
jgi:hypothetical protein